MSFSTKFTCLIIKVYLLYKPAWACRPKAGHGLIAIMMIMMISRNMVAIMAMLRIVAMVMMILIITLS